MKPVMIIAIVVAIGVISVIVVIQQSEISDIRRQQNFQSSVAQCNTIIDNVNHFSNEDVNLGVLEWQNCMDESMDKYGNASDKENWELSKQGMMSVDGLEVSQIVAIEKEKQQAEYDENKKLCLELYPNLSSEEDQWGYLRCLNIGVHEELLLECAKSGLDRINCIKIVFNDMLKIRNQQ